MPTPRTKEPDPRIGFGRIDKARYLTAAWAQREWEAIFRRCWMYAVPAQDVAEAGAWATFDIGPESILIARTEDGALHAHYNVCQHRGRRLVDADRGRSNAFRCSYHAWTYRLDGQLRSVHEPWVFDGRLDGCDMGLKPVRVGEWGGLVWICLDPHTEDLLDYLAPLPGHLSCYPLERYALVIDQSVEWDCNWKVAVDAFHETYHNMGTHPQIMGYAGDVNVQIDCYDRHTRFLLPNGAPAPAIRRRDRPTAAQIDLFARDGFDASEFEGTADEVLPIFQRYKRERMLSQGYGVEDLSLEQFTDNYHYTVFPNTQISVRASDALITRSRPHPSDPQRMIFDLESFVHVPPLAERPARPERQRGVGADFPFTPDFVRQDAANMPMIQAGLRSDGFQGSELSDLELRIRHWHHVYDAYLDGRDRLDRNDAPARNN